MSKSAASICVKTVAVLAVVAAAGMAQAAAPAYLIAHEASPSLSIDEAAASAVWLRNIPPQMPKLYPPKRYGYLAVIDGGVDAKGRCVVTARATMLPRSGKLLQFKPVRSAVVFESQDNSTREKCTELAKGELDQAIKGMLAGVVAGK